MCAHTDTHTNAKRQTPIHAIKQQTNCGLHPLTFIDFLVRCCNYYRRKEYSTGQKGMRKKKHILRGRQKGKRGRKKIEEGVKKNKIKNKKKVSVRWIET